MGAKRALLIRLRTKGRKASQRVSIERLPRFGRQVPGLQSRGLELVLTNFLKMIVFHNTSPFEKPVSHIFFFGTTK
jgi:hypothetical protein